MNDKSNDTLLFLVTDAVHLRKCQHLYLRGNFQMDMFYDKVDMINVWNRIWLSAKATGVQILSVEILNNHLHLNAIVQSDEQRTKFKTHFRMSITQYHNIRYEVKGTLGTRRLEHGVLKDIEDLKDCICYHIRNVRHHGISSNYLDYQFSTGRFVFGLEDEKQKGVFTRETLPTNLAKAYLPARERLPEGWMMTSEGLIVPPAGVFRSDMVEALFGTREDYLDQLAQTTTREASDSDEPKLGTYAGDLRNVPTPDEKIVEFVKENCRVPIPSMNENQKMDAISQIVEAYPRVNKKLLTRLFGIPYSTLRYRLKTWQLRR